MKHNRDAITVGKITLKRYHMKGWRMPGGEFTFNPLIAQQAAERAWERMKKVEQQPKWWQLETDRWGRTSEVKW